MNTTSNRQVINSRENTEGALKSNGGLSRRKFLRKSLVAGAGTVGAGWLLSDCTPAVAAGGLTPGDAALLRFAAAAEILETDFWVQ